MTPTEADRVEAFLDAAIDHYHTLLDRRHARGDDGHLRMLDEMLAAGVVYGGRPICPFLRPQFVTRSQLARVDHVCRAFRGAMIKAKDCMLADPELLERVGLTAGERRLAAIDPGFRSIGVTTRLDTFVIGHDVKFVELNAECPAGMHYGDTMATVFDKLDAMREFRERYPATHSSAADVLVKSLLDTWREWGGHRRPHVAVVDWAEVATRTEFDLVCRHLQAHGIDARFCDPRELEFSGGRLRAGGAPIDLVYRRLLTNELLAREDECRALVDAVAARAVCMFNSWRAKMLHKKMIFAILHDPRVARHYTAEEATVVRECVPWTRRVEPGRATDPDGAEVDLLEFVRANQQRLVIKPNDEYGGRGVVVGWNVERAVWETAIKIALDDPSIVQERVPLPKKPFPVLAGNTLEVADRYIDLDPYLFRGMLGGVLTRLSASPLCNVTAGGGSVPTFVLEGA